MLFSQQGCVHVWGAHDPLHCTGVVAVWALSPLRKKALEQPLPTPLEHVTCRARREQMCPRTTLQVEAAMGRDISAFLC